MNIDFHDQKNKATYSGRTVDHSWSQAMLKLVDPTGKHVVDVGSGGGIYSRAWLELGAASVIGVDFSQVMLSAARENTQDLAAITFVHGDALSTGLPDYSADIVFARALIHHLDDLDAFFGEMFRLLRPGGVCIVQDRTLKDIQFAGTAEHIRGYFFSCFPRLLETEKNRRPEREQVILALQRSGFVSLPPQTLWEVRRTYRLWDELKADLLGRTGRSILHALSDEELEALVSYMGHELSEQKPIVEKDKWSLWIGTKE